VPEAADAPAPEVESSPVAEAPDAAVTDGVPEAADAPAPEVESPPVAEAPVAAATDEAPADAAADGAAEAAATPAAEAETTAPAADTDSATAPAAEAEQPAADAETMTMDDWLEQEDSGPKIRRGDIVEGQVVQTSPTAILVDIGAKSEGVISGRELERMDRAALEALEVGRTVKVFVLNPEGRRGNPVLSLTRAQEEEDWREAEAYRESQKVYEGQVSGFNKGGLIVRFGKVRGFVPASQISAERRRRVSGSTPDERYAEMVGEKIMVKVIEVDRGRNRLILSERAAAREWRAQQKERLLDELTVGEQRQGRVISVADFGAFVDLGGADGLVHVSELTWRPVRHPRDVVKVGDTVNVKVISIDHERRRIGLSMKQLEENPWDRLARTHQVGQLVQATVTKLTKFGAFARLMDVEEVEGLIHISELAHRRIGHPREVVSVDDVLTLRIVKLDTQAERLGLSIKQVDSVEYADMDWQYSQQRMADNDADDDDYDNDAPTIGDMVDFDIDDFEDD
jgi:small subunit ribosomal protein S1